MRYLKECIHKKYIQLEGGEPILWANLNGADLSNADLRGADLSDANLCSADLSNADLRGADLSGADLRGADLSGADLSKANLSWANLNGAGLSWVNLSWANLNNADLCSVNLSDANLRDADLRGANLSWANLCSANLSGATGLLNPIEWLKENFEFTTEGIIVYKTFGKHYKPSINWNIKEGSILEEEVNYNRTDDCGCGINVATREWIAQNVAKTIWKCLIRYEDFCTIVVPYNTDGKFRVGKLELLETV